MKLYKRLSLTIFVVFLTISSITLSQKPIFGKTKTHTTITTTQGFVENVNVKMLKIKIDGRQYRIAKSVRIIYKDLEIPLDKIKIGDFVVISVVNKSIITHITLVNKSIE